MRRSPDMRDPQKVDATRLTDADLLTDPTELTYALESLAIRLREQIDRSQQEPQWSTLRLWVDPNWKGRAIALRAEVEVRRCPKASS